MIYTKILTSVALAFFVCGCGPSGDAPDLGDVTGTLMIDGKPISNVNVIFAPATGGRSSQGTTNEKGEYELVFSAASVGAKVGPHKVTISKDDVMAGAKASFPAKYTKITKEVEVKAGKNTIDLAYP